MENFADNNFLEKYVTNFDNNKNVELNNLKSKLPKLLVDQHCLLSYSRQFLE